jgi:hypothetical protein
MLLRSVPFRGSIMASRRPCLPILILRTIYIFAFARQTGAYSDSRKSKGGKGF